jgi:hypothetical protein
MIDIEAVEFAVRGEIDTGLALKAEDDASSVLARLFAGEGGEPVGDGVGTYGSSEHLQKLSQRHPLPFLSTNSRRDTTNP